MIIRTEQFEVFQPLADSQFVDEVVRHLLTAHKRTSVQFPNRTVSIEDISLETLRKMVQDGIARARDYGLTWESSLASFVSLMFVIAPNFDEHSSIRSILQDEKSLPDSRISQLQEQVSDEDWNAAEENYAPDAWKVNFIENPNRAEDITEFDEDEDEENDA